MPTSQRIRHVIFDAFATLFSPTEPVHAQYALVASQHGLSINSERLDAHIREAFKSTNKEYPIYGKAAGKDPAAWWRLVIEKAFLASGVPPPELSRVIPQLAQALIRRFSSSEGYTLHPDVFPTLNALRSHNISMGAISNSDPRITSVLKSLGVTPDFIAEEDIITSWDVGLAKPDPKIWRDAIRSENARRKARGEVILETGEVLHVGDSLHEDYHGAINAGLQAALLRRVNNSLASSAYRVESQDNLESMKTISSLENMLSIMGISVPFGSN